MGRFEHLTDAQIQTRLDRLAVLREKAAASFFTGPSAEMTKIDKVITAFKEELRLREPDMLYIYKKKEKFLVSLFLLGKSTHFGVYDTAKEAAAARDWLLAHPELIVPPPPGYTPTVQGYQPYIWQDGDGFTVSFNVNSVSNGHGTYPTIEQAMVVRDHFLPLQTISSRKYILKEPFRNFRLTIPPAGRAGRINNKGMFDTLEEAQAARDFFLSRPHLFIIPQGYVPTVHLPQNYIYSHDDLFVVKLGPKRLRGYFKTLESAIEVRDHFLSIENTLALPSGIRECNNYGINYSYSYGAPGGTRQYYTTLTEAIIGRNAQVSAEEQHTL